MSSSTLILAVVYSLLSVPLGIIGGIMLGYLLGGTVALFKDNS